MILMTYIGGFYSMESFIEEATRIGVSRRVSPGTARRLSFGDRTLLCSWRSGNPVAFAEFVIRQVYLETGTAALVGMGLEADGRARYIGGSAVSVKRECGSFEVDGGWETDADLSEIAERVCEITDEPWFMVGGPLTVVYEEPVPLPTETQFFRGFKALHDDGGGETSQGALLAVGNYEKRTRKKPRELELIEHRQEGN